MAWMLRYTEKLPMSCVKEDCKLHNIFFDVKERFQISRYLAILRKNKSDHKEASEEAHPRRFYIYTVTITTKSPGESASSFAGVGSGRSEVTIL